MTQINEEISKGKRILILCVDRDNDLSVKTGIKTPVIGKEKNLNAAIALALKDPEEPDANAMFEAIRIYDRLYSETRQNEAFEIATISGSELGGVGSDRKIVSELNEILSSYKADEVILVTDGYSDEAVLPLIESRVPVSSVRRIIIKHSESIEETAALFTRYLKIVLENPRYSRLALGLPGILLFILGILSIFNLVHFYLMAIVIVLGAFMFFKGFGVDKMAKSIYKWVKEYSPPPIRVQISTFSTLAGALCVVFGIYLGLENAITYFSSEDWMSFIPQIAGYFIKNSKDLIVSGVCVFLLGRAIRWYFERDSRLLRNSALIVLIVWSREIFESASRLLIDPKMGYEALIFSIIIGIMIGIASFLVIIVVHRIAKGFFKKAEREVEEFEET
jgi:putative membrane protein